MKSNIITTICLLITIPLSAQIDLPQGCVAEYDSTYITKGKNRNKQQFGPADSIYYLTREYLCADGREGAPKVPIGDSATVLNNLKRNAIDLSRQWAASVVISTLKNEAVINPVRTMNRTAQSLFNVNLYAEIAGLFQDSLIIGDYTLKPETGDPIPATITKNAQGQLRLRWGTNNTKQVIVLSDVHMRILNYTTGKDIDLVRRNDTTPKWNSDVTTITLVNKKLQAVQQAQASTIKNK